MSTSSCRSRSWSSVPSAAGLFLIVAARGRWVPIKREHRTSIVFLGFLGTINQLLYLYGLRFTTAANFAGLALLMPFGVASTIRFPLGSLAGSDWLGVAYLGIGTSVIGYLLWYYALRRIEASRPAVFSNGQPIVATVLSVIFLNAVITPQFLIGAAVTIAGVVAAQRVR